MYSFLGEAENRGIEKGMEQGMTQGINVSARIIRLHLDGRKNSEIASQEQLDEAIVDKVVAEFEKP